MHLIKYNGIAFVILVLVLLPKSFTSFQQNSKSIMELGITQLKSNKQKSNGHISWAVSQWRKRCITDSFWLLRITLIYNSYPPFTEIICFQNFP